MRHYALPETGFLRLSQIIGRPANPKRKTPAIPALIPVSAATWWRGIRSGRYPEPVKLGERTTAWRYEDIIRFIEATAAQCEQVQK